MRDRSVRVEIGGRAYNLGGADPERTRRLAQKVDEAISRFADTMGVGADSYQLAILAALHIADELETVSDEHERYRAEIGATVQELLTALQSGVAGIDEEVDALRARESPAQSDLLDVTS